MARIPSFKSIEQALRAPFMARFGLKGSSFVDGMDYAMSNGFVQKALKADGTGAMPIFQLDSDNALRLGESAMKPFLSSETFVLSTNGSLADQVFFIADKDCIVTEISEVHKTAGNDAAAVTLNVTVGRGADTHTAPGSGTSLMTGTFNLKGTANTVQNATLVADPFTYPGALKLRRGDRLSANFTGVLTTLAGVCVTVTFAPGNKGNYATYAMNANGDIATQSFFVANRPMVVRDVLYFHTTKGSNASAVTVQLTKDTGTNAPGAGTALLTNNTNAGFDAKGANLTYQVGTLTATAASLRLAPGDRLSVKFTGTLTSLAGVVMVVVFAPTYGRKELTFTLNKNANLTAQNFFTADQDYEVVHISEVHSTAGSDGSAVNLNVTVDTGTTAPGAGTVLATDNTNAGFDMKGTANTVQNSTLITSDSCILLTGERLGLKFAGTLTALAGVSLTVSLRPAR